MTMRNEQGKENNVGFILNIKYKRRHLKHVFLRIVWLMLLYFVVTIYGAYMVLIWCHNDR